MAVITAQATGNWSATGTWSGGVVPTTGDTARTSTFTVTIDQDITVALLEGTSSGHFAVTAARSIAAAVTSSTGHSGGGVVRCSHSSGTVTITGDITAGPATSSRAIDLTGNGTISIVGNVGAGNGASTIGVFNNSASGTINITGNVTGGGGSNGVGSQNNSTGTIAVTGNVTGGSASTAYGINNSGLGTITVSGTATGGSASAAYGANNVGGGTLRVGTAIGNDYGPSGTHSVGVAGLSGTNSASAITTYKALQFGAHGQSPISGCAYCEDSAGANTAKVYHTASTFVVLTDPADATDFPAIADVRSGTTYGSGTYTGTLAVPAANQVSVGVAVDATTGTAVLTAAAAENAIWNAVRSSHTTDGTYGDTAEWAGGGTPPTAGEIADAVWDEATSGHTTSGTFGEQLKTDVDAILGDTNELQTDWVDGGRLDLILDARASQSSVTTIDDFLDTEIADIKAKTDNLPVAPAATGDIPSAASIVAAMMAYAVESGHTVETVLEALYAIARGKAVADAADPTSIIYYAPDNTTARVTHTLSSTTRTVA